VRRVAAVTQEQAEQLLEEEELQKQHGNDLQVIRGCLRRHTPPSTLIGCGAASFAHKLSALLHGMRLETFTSRGLADFCSEIICVVSDDGTERLLPGLTPTPLHSICPHFEDTTARGIKLFLHSTGSLRLEDTFEEEPPYWLRHGRRPWPPGGGSI